MSIEEIRKRHEREILERNAYDLPPTNWRQPSVGWGLFDRTHQDRAKLLRVIDALLEIPIDMHDGAELTVGDTREAIAILRGEGGDE